MRITSYTRKKCNGAASAAVAQGIVFAENCRWKKNGKIVNTAANPMYQTSGRVARSGLKCPKCQAYSNARVDPRPTAESKSRENIFAMPRSKTTNRSARPKTGDGFASGSRSVTMISKRKGSVADKAGSWIAKLAGSLGEPNNFPRVVVASPAQASSCRHAQTATSRKKMAKHPRRNSEVGNPVSSIGIRQIHPPITTKVRTRTTRIGNRAPAATAKKMASRSTHNTSGQTRNETSDKLNIGIRINTSASAGKR